MSVSKNCLTLLLGVAGPAIAAQDPSVDPRPPESSPTVPLSYVSSNARIGLGIDRDGDIQGEALGVLGYDGERAFLTEGWVGNGGAGGLQAGYHWLWGGATRQDTILRPATLTVAKFFMAVDQNAARDRKGSIGLGLERAGFGLDVYYSHALTDERLLSSDVKVVQATQSGEDNGRIFQQDVVTTTLTQQFEHPYDQGIGFRLARFFEQPLLRLRGGLDYERGDTLLQGDSASQLTAALALEKHFMNSPHSLGLELEHFHKQGPFDGGRRDDTRAMLMWRYEFGEPFRPTQNYRERQITHTVQPPPAKPEIRRTELQLSSQALFEFNRAEVTAAAKAQLRGLVKQLKERRVGPVEIVGHTCDLGSDEYNQRLSERRAAAVRDWLIAEGVPAADLLASGRGESQPAYPNDSEENRARNRRIALSFMSFEQTVIAHENKPETTIETVREEVPTPAAWIERALRTPAAHKRTVDTYHIERVTQTRTLGERVFINRAPRAVDDAVTAQQERALTFSVLANDTDPDGDVLSVTSVGTPGNGSVVINNDGTLTYSPNAGFLGADTFVYTARDPGGLTATATVVVSVQNHAPVAVNDDVATQHDVPVAVSVLANDSDADGDSISLAAHGDAGHGQVVQNNDGTFTYTPDAGFFGADSFTYSIKDRVGSTATATVTVTVRDQAPTVANDAASMHIGSVTVAVLDNDSDADGDRISLLAHGDPGNGTLIVNANDTFTYTPARGFVGDDSFTYTIRDTAGATATGTVTVTVQNEAPIAVNDSADLGDPGPDGVTLIRALLNDSDPDGDTLTVRITRQPDVGTAGTAPGGLLVYTPFNPGSTAGDSFEYTITDSGGLTATATVTILGSIIL